MIDNIIEQLIEIYYKYEWWHTSKLPKEEAHKYFLKMLAQGNILVIMQDEKLYGYCEFWRLNYEQFGRVICGENIYFDEDRLSGKICYLANVWIDPLCKNHEIMKVLKKMFFNANADCDYYVGEARRKRTGLIKVFKKNDLKSKLFTLGRV